MTTEQHSPERRKRRRRRVQVDSRISLSSHDNFYAGFVENISFGGLFVAAHDPKPIGSRFRVHVTLPDGSADFVAPCEVRWHRLEQKGNPNAVAGMGLRFLSLTDEQKEAINGFMKRRETIFYVDEFDEIEDESE